MRSIKPEILQDLLKKQQFLLENQLFDPYAYFGISQLRKNSEKLDIRSPILKIRKNYESMLCQSFNKEENGLNRSLSMQREPYRQKKNIRTKPFHLKIDLNESLHKKNFDISSSRSASKLSVKNNFKSPQNSEKTSFQTVKKMNCKGFNEKRECYFTEIKKKEKKEEKNKEIDNKKKILTENAEIINTMKGLDAKYQGIYLNLVRANKKKN